MENSYPTTDTATRKQRLLPLNIQIIKTMAHFNSSSTSSTGGPNQSEIANNISEEVRKAVFIALKGVPYIHKLINIESLAKLIDTCLWVDGLNNDGPNQDVNVIKTHSSKISYSNGHLTEKSSKRKVKEADLHSWLILNHNIDTLRKRISELETKILSSLNDIPEWKRLNINQLSINIETVVDRLASFIDESFCHALKSAIDRKYKTFQFCDNSLGNTTQSEKRSLRKMVENEKLASLEETLTDKESCHDNESENKNIETVQIVVESEEPDRDFDNGCSENQRSLYERIQYELNTNFFLKSDTSMSLNQRKVFNVKKIPVLPLSTANYEKYPLVKYLNQKL